jgi:histidinol-phosphate aminotransferase
MQKKSIRKLAQLHGWWVYKGFLEKTNRFTEDERQAWIHDRLKQTLIRAFEGTRYYAEVFDKIGFDPRTDFQGPQTLTALPLLTKNIIRERFDDLVDKRYQFLSAYAETSGTTGQPLRMKLNESFIALDYACMYQMWAQAGYRFRDPFLALRSYVPSNANEPLWKHDRAQNTLFMSAYHFSPRNAEAYMHTIAAFKPKFIRSYPSSLMVLADYLERTGQRIPSVRALFTASETLSAHERDIIERVFGPILFDWYGMTEPSLVGFESIEHDGLNIAWQYGHAEFIPDSSLSAGDFRLIATSLANSVMPFIRYDTGDIVTRHVLEPSDTLYPRRLGSIKGRKDDLILTPDGRRLPSVNFYSVFRSAPGVVRFQIVQYGTSDIVVNIETTEENFMSSPSYADLRTELRSRFGDEMSVEYRLNVPFETSHDGKCPVVLRRRANKAIEERKEYALSSQIAWQWHRQGESIMKLDWNEADASPSAKVREKLVALIEDSCSLIWYPEACPAALHQALAKHHQIDTDNVLATHGSDMALSYLVECFVNTGDKVLIISPSYDNFRAVAEQRGAKVIAFTFEGDGDFPLEQLISHIHQNLPRVIYLTNPNNPVGYHLSRSSISRLCQAATSVSSLVIVDEAYADFAPEDAVPLIADYTNLVIVRTFSKACGLAGLRIGHLIADTAIIATVKRVANPKHLTTFAQVAALATLEDWSSVEHSINVIKQQRQCFIDFLRRQGTKCYDSHGNFVLLHTTNPKVMTDWFETRGILLRDRSAQIRGTVRVSIGGKETMERLITAFEEFTRIKAGDP